MAAPVPPPPPTPRPSRAREPPLWLTSHGRAAQAAAVVRRHLGENVRAPAAPARRPERHRRSELFAPTWRLRTAVGAVFFTCQVVPYFAVGTFISQILVELHVRSSYAGGLF